MSLHSYKGLNRIRKKSGFTLIELILVIALLLIVLMAVYNILFLGLFAYEKISEDSLVAMEIQLVIAQIERDVRQARKPNDDQDPVVRINSQELIIYTDITQDGKPEQIRYLVDGGVFKRSYRSSSNAEYPYTYSGSYGNERRLIINISNNDIFSEPEEVTIPEHTYSPPDYRRKLSLKIVIDSLDIRGGSLEIEKFLMSRSRVEAD
ncbi:hypothetical protein Amet_3477 [Alkaliphilus metalliredigens QYMF]|uniref:Prepilin-type N-terminal cleavage/methylation domain-containing protein n=1 Tax=Alkaliphilus metalliredigens (strain QYMF) TaxID=293826 RepID=A6TTT7_ALKMQ|nr:prepilin-type N-terminal cleavage/methylation domain-containing protein [Alkaliphilus metalliredigens]ABR49605.1 hypothetical protein Amet_3477 [Alkaliphilus metalliredigens QYMF]